MSRRGRPAAAGARRRVRLDGFEAVVLGAFALVSVWVLALDVWQVTAHGRSWTGTDGVYVVDQLQYLAWVRDASRHVLVSNLFVLRTTPADYFQPAVVLSGGLSALGVAPWLSLLLWKPVAVLAFFFSVRQYVARSLPGRAARRAALVLALFFGSFTVLYGSVTAIGDLFPGFLSWGYVFALLALAAMLAALVTYDRLQGAGRLGWWPGVLGAIASSLHPWQGELLIVIVLASEAIMRLRRQRVARRPALASLTVALTALPLVYYVALGRADVVWRLARVASKHAFPLWSIAIAVAPLLIPALFAYRRPAAGFLATATRVWPVAGFGIFVVSGTALGATPLHAFQGISVPLAILAVEACQRLDLSRLPARAALGWLAVGLLTLPATWYQLDNARKLVAPRGGTANFITHDERRALDFLDHLPVAGGVLSRSYLGLTVPALTGRHTYVGDCLWSQPGCDARLVAVKRLFTGGLTAPAARRFVLGTGARFLLADCRDGADMAKLLGPVVRAVRRFGCARVYAIG